MFTASNTFARARLQHAYGTENVHAVHCKYHTVHDGCEVEYWCRRVRVRLPPKTNGIDQHMRTFCNRYSDKRMQGRLDAF